MSKYILLSAMSPDQFGLSTFAEIEEALAEFGASTLISHQPNGESVVYAVANTKEALLRMCETVDLPGIVLEYTAIYDQCEVIS